MTEPDSLSWTAEVAVLRRLLDWGQTRTESSGSALEATPAAGSAQPGEASPAEQEIETLVSRWGAGRAGIDGQGDLSLQPLGPRGLAERMRSAYVWITERAILCDQVDLEFGEIAVLRGETGSMELRRADGYASQVLLPLLGLVTGSTVLFVGAPGRGKTSIATLMGLLAGASLQNVRRWTQRGHPQLTVSDLLGAPLPGDLVRAERPENIRVTWRGWLRERVKIVDEFNRLPTKTQSALLSLMAEGCAEQFEQVVETGTSAWYLTANDEAGGGTFQVIEALRDRIDMVVRVGPLSPRGTAHLAERVTSGRLPETELPGELVLSGAELDAALQEILRIPIAPDAIEALGWFTSQVAFCRRASDRPEHMYKDTLHVAGRRLAHVCNEDCPLDKVENVCSQTMSGVSTRAQLGLLRLGKALAWFRGARRVELEDLRLLLPFVLHDRLAPNASSGFFLDEKHQVHLSDRIHWLRSVFDRAVTHARAHAARRAVHDTLAAETEAALASRDPDAPARQIKRIEAALQSLLRDHELNALVHDDLLRLRSLHARCRAGRHP